MIPNKEISEKEFREKIVWKRISSGGEATVCKADTPNSVYKLFSNDITPIAMPENKVKKIQRLYEMQPLHCVTPLSTISLNDIIVGYEMTSDEYLTQTKMKFLSLEEKKYFLNKTKEILEYFSSIGIIYGDIAPRNILFNTYTGKIEFCDMDNIAIDNLPMDALPGDAKHYNSYRPIDERIHPYMHNIMTLKQFVIDIYWPKRSEIKENFKRPAIKTIKSMKNPSNFNNEYIIQYLKK